MTDSRRGRRRAALFGIATVVLGLAAALAVGEMAVRLVGRVDAHGTFHLRSHRIPPFRYDGGAYGADIDRRRARGPGRLRHDPVLGWVASHRASETGLPPALRGIYRDSTEYRLAPEEGVRRIVLVGDSFTRAVEVGYHDSWGYVMQERLKAAGVRVEVLNLGVGGYGIDQAYLRWASQGRALRPGILIFGFQPENLLRNLNVFRPFYLPGTAIPLTKPRFQLDGDTLVLRNVPAIRPEDVPAFVDDFWAHPLAELEAFRRREDERVPLWRRSRLLSSAATIGRRKILGRPDHPDSEFFGVDTEAGRVGLALLRRFELEAGADGASFLVLHLPRAGVEVSESLEGRPLGYVELLDTIGARHTVIDPLNVLVAEARSQQDAARMQMPRGHYTPLANRIVGEYAADTLASLIRAGALDPGRVAGTEGRP